MWAGSAKTTRTPVCGFPNGESIVSPTGWVARPAETAEAQWRGELEEISARIVECCRRVDPTSTEKVLEEAAGEVAEEE